MGLILEIIFAFCTFCFVASITPGPTNFLIFSISSQSQVKNTVGLIFGASIGASFLVLIAGFGFVSLFNKFSYLKIVLGLIGAIWMSYLSWQIFNYSPNFSDQHKKSHYGLITGFLMQFINPKSWLMAIAVINIYITQMTHYIQALFTCAFIFLIISTPCLFFWAYLGRASRNILAAPKNIILFNRILSIILLISIWYPILHTLKIF